MFNVLKSYGLENDISLIKKNWHKNILKTVLAFWNDFGIIINA